MAAYKGHVNRTIKNATAQATAITKMLSDAEGAGMVLGVAARREAIQQLTASMSTLDKQLKSFNDASLPSLSSERYTTP